VVFINCKFAEMYNVIMHPLDDLFHYKLFSIPYTRFDVDFVELALCQHIYWYSFGRYMKNAFPPT